MTGTDEVLRRARSAYERHDWPAAYQDLKRLHEQQALATDDLHALGDAAWWLRLIRETLALSDQCYQRFLDEGRWIGRHERPRHRLRLVPPRRAHCRVRLDRPRPTTPHRAARGREPRIPALARLERSPRGRRPRHCARRRPGHPGPRSLPRFAGADLSRAARRGDRGRAPPGASTRSIHRSPGTCAPRSAPGPSARTRPRTPFAGGSEPRQPRARRSSTMSVAAAGVGSPAGGFAS